MTYDREESRSERDKGMDRVRRKSEPWFGMAFVVIANMPGGWRGIAEDFHRIIESSVGPPSRYGVHHNIYGTLTRIAIREGLLEPTGDYGQMKKKTSHARGHAPIYMRTHKLHPIEVNGHGRTTAEDTTPFSSFDPD